MTDQFVEEIHETRRRIAEECNNDIKEIGQRLMRVQEQHPELLVPDVPKSDPEPIPT